MEPSSKKNLKENSLPKNVFEAAETLLLPKIFAGYRAVVEKWLSGRETAELPVFIHIVFHGFRFELRGDFSSCVIRIGRGSFCHFCKVAWGRTTGGCYSCGISVHISEFFRGICRAVY